MLSNHPQAGGPAVHGIVLLIIRKSHFGFYIFYYSYLRVFTGFTIEALLKATPKIVALKIRK